MNTLIDKAQRVAVVGGEIVVVMESGAEMRFPISANKRLAGATDTQVAKIEISPFGLHWPDLDEDLSFRGILAGNFGSAL